MIILSGAEAILPRNADESNSTGKDLLLQFRLSTCSLQFLNLSTLYFPSFPLSPFDFSSLKTLYSLSPISMSLQLLFWCPGDSRDSNLKVTTIRSYIVSCNNTSIWASLRKMKDSRLPFGYNGYNFRLIEIYPSSFEGREDVTFFSSFGS